MRPNPTTRQTPHSAVGTMCAAQVSNSKEGPPRLSLFCDGNQIGKRLQVTTSNRLTGGGPPTSCARPSASVGTAVTMKRSQLSWRGDLRLRSSTHFDATEQSFSVFSEQIELTFTQHAGRGPTKLNETLDVLFDPSKCLKMDADGGLLLVP